MKIRILFFALAALFVMSFSVPPQWELLGVRKVDYKIDKDVIPVGAHEGAFTKLKVEVKGGSLNMHKMTVHYGNGTSQEIELKHNFIKGSSSRIIDLTGNQRIIKSITFFYDSKNLSNSKAKVLVFGRH